MTVPFTLINFRAATETDAATIARADFHAANLSERTQRRASAAAERIQAQRDLDAAERQFTKNFRESFEDIGESKLILDAAYELADLARAFSVQAAGLLANIRNTERSLVEPSDIAEEAADLLTDQLSRDPLARDLAGVVVAALRAQVQ